MVHPRVLLPVFVVAVVVPAAARQDPPAREGQRPVFRGGAHCVRVDAYPIGKDGRILPGADQGRLEIFEDGKPQTIERAELTPIRVQ